MAAKRGRSITGFGSFLNPFSIGGSNVPDTGIGTRVLHKTGSHEIRQMSERPIQGSGQRATKQTGQRQTHGAGKRDTHDAEG